MVYAVARLFYHVARFSSKLKQDSILLKNDLPLIVLFVHQSHVIIWKMS